jgi:hypothetical protein
MGIKNLYFYAGVTSLGNNSFEKYGSTTGPEVLYTENDPDVLNWSITSICGSSSNATFGEFNGAF